jgi:two-component system response regulator AtoC
LLKEVTKAATQDLERQIILKVLESNGWSRRKTAKWLNISYRSLLYKLQNSQAAEFSESPLMTGILNSMANLTQTMGPPKEVGRAGVSQESAVLKRLSYIQPRTA